MTKQYEYMTLDAGHEYTQPCEVLFETKSNYLIKLPDCEKLVWKDSTGNDSVREVKKKVNVYEVVAKCVCAYVKLGGNGDLVVDTKGVTEYLLEVGALSEGMYEI